MKLNDLDEQQIQAARIRELQSRYPQAHEALMNWGAWSRDRSGMYPAISQTHVFDQYVHDETEGYAEEGEGVTNPHAVIVTKAERDSEDYDEKSAVALDARLHPDLAEYLRIVLRAAYVDGGPREGRWYVYANCSTPDQFLERLELAFRFVGRWV